MNALITSLNSWGERFLKLAGPMLWQSSLLILVLFALDLALRRKVRPAVRYALWLVLLVKLLLPPTLAVPTSIAWWIRPSPSPQRPASQFVVTYPNGGGVQPGLNIYESFTGGQLQSPRAKLSWRGWFLVGSSFMSLGLLTWMLRRWWQIARLVRRASPATESLAKSLEDTRRILGLRRNVRLRFTDQPMSPAVCGLFRPVIILPQTLAEQLPPNQLRAVLLHELAHLKRGDVWVNCAQAVLQVVYWWHPLLWLANARIRRLREEAVDDAVMLALRDDAPTYAPTLLEVAKLAFHRPTTALGLVGIMESRSALRQRIERIVNSDTPRKSGLTILSAVGVLAFSALAVPMEQAPVTTIAGNSTQANSGSQDSLPANTLSASPVTTETNAAKLVESGKLLLEMGKLDEAEGRLEKALAIDTENQRARYYPDQIKQARNSKSEHPSARTTGRREIVQKLRRIRLDRVFYDNVPLEEVIRSLHEEIKRGDLHGPVVNIILNPNLKDYVATTELQWPQIKVNPALTNITLGDLLEIIVKVADRPIRYSIEDFGVVFSSPSSNSAPALYGGEFKVDPQSFGKWLQYAATTASADVSDPTPANNSRTILPRVDPRGMAPPALSPSVQPDLPRTPERGGVVSLKGTNNLERMHQALRGLFSASGVDLSPPKAVFYNDRVGLLLVNATQSDLDKIERLVQTWNTTSPPDATAAARPSSGSDQTPRPAATTNDKSQPSTQTAPLTIRRYKVDPNTFLKALESTTTLPITRTNASAALRDFFGHLGVELNPPKSIFFNDRAGELLVRATMRDLDTIETAVQVLNTPAQQVNIKVQFVEIPVAEIRSLGFDWYPSNTVAQFSGILTEAQFRTVLRTLENRTRVDILTGPQVITVSGRQAQIQTVDILTVVKGINPLALTPPGITSTNSATNSVYLTETIPCGPVLDVIPTVEADGHTISMTVIPTVTEFLGYDKPASANKVPVYINGKKEWVTATPLPKFRTRQITTSARVWDGQTLVLGGFTASDSVRVKDKTPVLGDVPGVGSLFRSESRRTEKKNLIVFVTPTLVDPTGNRVHAEVQLPKSK